MIELCSTDFDDNCDGEINEDTASDTLLWYEDGDNDTYGDENDAGTAYCDPPSGVSTNNGDCNDGVGGINPGATEVCPRAAISSSR